MTLLNKDHCNDHCLHPSVCSYRWALLQCSQSRRDGRGWVLAGFASCQTRRWGSRRHSKRTHNEFAKVVIFFFFQFFLIQVCLFRMVLKMSWTLENKMNTILGSKSDASSRTDFWDKNRAIFRRDFSGEEFLPENNFLGPKIRSILSNHVISWNGSRADRCPLGREITAKKCSLLFMNSCFMKFLYWTCSLLLWFMNPLSTANYLEQVVYR